jgi:ligand-binding SRPBCC domain-containing protein
MKKWIKSIEINAPIEVVWKLFCLVQNESTEFCNKKVQSFMA